jgi:hypothetical protein
MAQRLKIGSNETSLRYAVEASIGVLPGSPENDESIWKTAEPNSYSDFGGDTTLVARQPINSDRQRRKGKVVDIEAAVGFAQDLTRYNSNDFLESFMFAATRKKTNEAPTAVTSTGYTVADESDYAAGMLLYASGFATAANNGLKLVTGTDTNEAEVSGLTAEASPPAAAKIELVGIQLDADDMAITNGTTLPILTQSTFDLTTLGLVEGQWIFVGGDTASLRMGTSGNNGFKRIKTVAAGALTLDITETAMANETLSGGETLQIFFGDFLKNEKDNTDQIVKSLQFEREMSYPDDASPSALQAEYIKGSVGNELTINFPEAGLITIDYTFQPTASEVIDSSGTLKSVEAVAGNGSVEDVSDGEGYSTTGDLKAAVLYTIDAAAAAPTQLFTYASEATISINNNLTLTKALGVIGGFDVNPGTFVVSGEIEAYFVDVAAIAAVRNNADVGFFMAMTVDNAGIVFDIPLIALSGGRADIALNEPIKIPLEKSGATARRYGSQLDFTLGLTIFNYLPTLAAA